MVWYGLLLACRRGLLHLLRFQSYVCTYVSASRHKNKDYRQHANANANASANSECNCGCRAMPFDLQFYCGLLVVRTITLCESTVLCRLGFGLGAF